MQFGEPFYTELRVNGLIAADAAPIATTLQETLASVPNQIELIFERTYPSMYWRRVALRYPEMIRFAHQYTRVGVEDDQAIANVTLPGVAAHNLIFGAQMLLSRGAAPQPAETSPAIAQTPATRPATIQELLQVGWDLRFNQKSLEFAIQDLAEEIREAYPRLPFPFDIQILGSDLQLNGITRNQQISNFTAEDQSIADILTLIVRRANPVTTVTDPSESDQKLVWVIGPDPDDSEKQIVLITTREAAARDGYTLPAPFQPK
jgi:hypothetical protein